MLEVAWSRRGGRIGKEQRWKQLLDCPVFDRSVTRRRMAKSWLLRIGRVQCEKERQRELAARQLLLCNTHASGLSLSSTHKTSQVWDASIFHRVEEEDQQQVAVQVGAVHCSPFTSPFTRRFHPFYTKLQGPIPKVSHPLSGNRCFSGNPTLITSSLWINRAFDLAYQYEQGSNSYIFWYIIFFLTSRRRHVHVLSVVVMEVCASGQCRAGINEGSMYRIGGLCRSLGYLLCL